MAATRAAQNRKIRQEALREQLAAQGHVQHVVDICEELSGQLPASDVNRLKTKADIHLKLIDKYLPSVKAVEHTGEGGDELPTSISVNLVKPSEP